MRFTTATIVSALAVAASALTNPDYTKTPSGNAIVSPGLNEIVPEGKAYTIKWDPTTTGPVSLILLRGPSTNVQPLKTLADSIPNSGSFTWTPSTDLEVDTTHYGLLLVVEGTGQYQYSTQFGIGAAAGGSSIVVSTTAPAATGAATTVESTSAPATTATPAFSTVVSSTEITTTICPETETTVAQTSTVAPVNSPSSIPWVSSARTSATSAVIPSGTASASPSASSPVFNGAGCNAISFGAVFAGVLAAFAL